MEKNKLSWVYIAAIVFSIITGLSFIFGKTALNYSNPIDLLAYRFSAAFIALLIPIMFKWVKINLSFAQIKKILPLAIFYPMLFFGFQTFGLKHTLSSEAGIYLAVGPVFTMILASYFLKETTTALQKLSILLSVFGTIYITYKKGATLDLSDIKGIVFLLLSVLSFAFYSVMARKLTRDFSNIELSTVMITIGFIAFNMLAIVNHLIAGDITSFLQPMTEPTYVIAILYLGVLSTMLTSFLTNYILSKLESYKMSVFTNLATVISIIAGVIFLSEQIFYYHIIGSTFIVVGVLGANFLGKKKSPN